MNLTLSNLIDYQIICGKTLEVKRSSISNVMKRSYDIPLKKL